MQITPKAARVNAGLTQVEAAKRLGISVQTLINWERDPQNISALKQKQISDTYQIPVEHINFLPSD